jgi:hypothetical protein
MSNFTQQHLANILPEVQKLRAVHLIDFITMDSEFFLTHEKIL